MLYLQATYTWTDTILCFFSKEQQLRTKNLKSVGQSKDCRDFDGRQPGLSTLK